MTAWLWPQVVHVLSCVSVLQLNENFVTEDCSQSCVSTSTGAACQPKTCPAGYVCTIYDFKRDCYRGLWDFVGTCVCLS